MIIKILSSELSRKVGNALQFNLDREITIEELKEELTRRFELKGEFSEFFYNFSVNGKLVRQEEHKSFKLKNDDVVVIIPSIAGGKIKKLIMDNFSESIAKYEEFEEKHGFFKSLARKLLEFGEISSKGLYLDIGCGTGIIGEIAPQLKVLGLDVSPEMARVSKKRMQSIVADAESLPFRNESFDAAFFNASLFLIPNAKRALEEALRVVRDGGVVLASYLLGFYEGDEKVVERYGLRHREVFPSEKIDLMAEKFDGELLDVTFNVTGEFMKDFYLVPAMANAIFPRIPYEERVKRIEETFNPLPKSLELRCRIMKVRA
jgi:ubiquinone/menaquinone biosynthesis C-methylase UbiE